MKDPFRVQRMMAAQIQAECRAARAHLLLEARRDRASADAIRDTDPELATQLDERAQRSRAEARDMRRDPVLAQAKVERWNNPPAKTTAKVTAAHPHGTIARQARHARRPRERRPSARRATSRRSGQRRAASSTARGGSRSNPDSSGDDPPGGWPPPTGRVVGSGNLDVRRWSL